MINYAPVMTLGNTGTTAATASRMQAFTEGLADGYRVLVDCGEFASRESRPSRLVFNALVMEGGILPPLFVAYCEAPMTLLDLPFLDVIIRCLDKLFEMGEDVARRLGLITRSGLAYVHRFDINPRRLFSDKFFEKRIAHATADRRDRLVVLLVSAFRQVLAWLHDAFQRLEARLVADPMRPIRLAPYARTVVHVASCADGLFVLKAGPREGTLPFHVLPTSKAAWRHLRALCETTRPDGYVELPPNYASAFHRTDANNDTVRTDCERLLRHIVPGPEKGHYRLELTPKEPLLRGL